jgi:hypothetical protein
MLIRNGQIRWLPKGEVVGQRQFIHTLFGLALDFLSYPIASTESLTRFPSGFCLTFPDSALLSD